jgi:hydrogenase expression/formation protein HypC
MTGVPDGSRLAMTRDAWWIGGIQNGFPAESAPSCAIARIKARNRGQESPVCVTGGFGLKYRAVCLAIPVKIVSIDGDQAETEIGGVRRRVSIAFTPEARVGDYVLLHTGYAIGVVDEAEAEETLKLLEEIASLSEVH